MFVKANGINHLFLELLIFIFLMLLCSIKKALPRGKAFENISK